MISGLKFYFTTEELADHMAERAEYHDRRAAEKSGQLPKIKEAIATLARSPPGGNSNYSFGGAIGADRELESDIKSHKKKAAIYRVLVAHLAPDEIYVLPESDLIRLEIVK